MATRSYLVPGLGAITETTNKSYLVPGIGAVTETQSSTTATTYSFSGASSGKVNVASGTISLTPTAGNWPSSVTLTLSDGGAGGTLTPSSLSPSAGTSTPVTFTYTPVSTGTKNISSSSGGAMTDPSSWAYNSLGGLLINSFLDGLSFSGSGQFMRLQ